MSFALPQERARLSYAQSHPMQHTFPVQVQAGQGNPRSPQLPHPSQPSQASQLSQLPNSSPYTHAVINGNGAGNGIGNGIGNGNGIGQQGPSAQGTPAPNPQNNQDNTNAFIYQLQQASQAQTISPAPSNSTQQSTPQSVQSQSVSQSQTPSDPSQPLLSSNGTSNGSSNGLSRVPLNISASMPLDESPISMIDDLTIEKMVPPPEATYPTFEALLHYANRHAFAHGYAMVIGRSKRKNKNGFKKVLLACDRAGSSVKKGSAIAMDPTLRKRKTTSRKTGCNFGIYAIEGPMEWKLQWRPDPGTCSHNHGPSKDVTEHPAARKLNASAVAAVKALKDAGLSVQETVKQIQLAQPGALLIARDVYNARAALRREPERDAAIDPAIAPPQIYRRATMSAEERLRDDCRIEVANVKEELERVRRDLTSEVERLKGELREKDKMIGKFEMFIDLCNQRVMVQRERLNDETGPQIGNVGAVGS